MHAVSLRALLDQSVDYAGLFPPASLTLEPALRNHASYVRSPDSWMLGAFVLPIGQFDAASEGLSQFDREHPLRISALGKKTDDVAAFVESLKATRDAIRSFSARHGAAATINQIEMPLPDQADGDLMKKIRSIVGDLKLTGFWEAPPDSAERTIKLIAENRTSASSHEFGYKLRTGGVTADAFPSSAQIAAALVAATRHRVPIKFTAGLHHPLRQYREEVQTKMHGFLNVLGAAVLAAEHKWDAAQTTAMLEDEGVSSFKFDDEFFAWRDWKIGIERLRDRRRFVTTFGSCSFDEPRDDLRALKLL
jgi:hypothetical protein